MISTTFDIIFTTALCQLSNKILVAETRILQYLVSKGYICLHKLSDYVTSLTCWLRWRYRRFCRGFVRLFPGANPGKPFPGGHRRGKKRTPSIFPIFSSGFPPRGLTIERKCAKLQVIKGCEEDTRFGKMLQREAGW